MVPLSYTTTIVSLIKRVIRLCEPTLVLHKSIKELVLIIFPSDTLSNIPRIATKLFEMCAPIYLANRIYLQKASDAKKMKVLQ